MSNLESIRYSNGNLILLNQLLLPQQIVYEDCSSCVKAFDAIKTMKVRGAPAIAITAALALACELKNTSLNSYEDYKNFVFSKLDYLCESRPTAVNLFKMANEVKKLFLTSFVSEKMPSLSEFKHSLMHFLEKMFKDDIDANKAIGAHGARLLLTKFCRKLNILTHCNTGSLATAGYGTALGVIRCLNAQQKIEHVYATETRPYNQGARLTAFELVYEKIPSTLITDSMVSFLMKTKAIDAIVVGADRVACNGDTANKIGTYQIAVAAAYHGVPFYVAAPTTTLDFATKCGDDIHIEERPAIEMTHIQNIQIAANGIGIWNPSFDVTPAQLITGIITEKGVLLNKINGVFDIPQEIKTKM